MPSKNWQQKLHLVKPFKRCFSPWLRAKPDFIAAVPPRGIWIPGMLKYLLKTSAKIFGGSTMTYHTPVGSFSPPRSRFPFWTWHVDTLSWWKNRHLKKPRQWRCLALQTSYGVPKSPAADFKGQKIKREDMKWHFGQTLYILAILKASQSMNNFLISNENIAAMMQLGRGHFAIKTSQELLTIL